jgi:hypothetical protein
MEAPQPPAPTTGVEVKVQFFPLAFLFLFCTPIVTVDGVPHRLGWGTHFFHLQPGRHVVRVFFYYLFMPQCGDNSVAFDVQEGEVRLVSFYMPPWIFMRGAMSVT